MKRSIFFLLLHFQALLAAILFLNACSEVEQSNSPESSFLSPESIYLSGENAKIVNGELGFKRGRYITWEGDASLIWEVDIPNDGTVGEKALQVMREVKSEIREL